MLNMCVANYTYEIYIHVICRFTMQFGIVKCCRYFVRLPSYTPTYNLT